MLLFYFCLTITVGKQVRICCQLLVGKNFIAKTLALTFDQGEAENEGTDSEDSEGGDEDNDDHELTSQQTLRLTKGSSPTNSSISKLFKDHLKEIGTPPPRS